MSGREQRTGNKGKREELAINNEQHRPYGWIKSVVRTLNAEEYFMKKLFKLLAIIAFIAVIAFSMAACNNGTTGKGGGPDPALTGTVSINGTAEVGQTLTADTTALGGKGTISYQWKRGETVVGTDSTYVIVADDAGETITVTVTRSGNSGSKTSDPTAVVIFPSLSGTVSISGTAEAGQTLTADTTALGGSGTINYQWKRGEDTDIGTESTYEVVDDDIGFTITVTVTRSGYTGSVTSDPTAVVIAKPGTLNVTVTIVTDAAISGSSITDGVLTLSRSGSATLTLANNGSYDEGSIRWKVQNTAITGRGTSFVLNGANLVYQTGKLYFVTVQAEKSGIPLDQTITFKVQ